MVSDDALQRARNQSVIGYLQHLGITGKMSGKTWKCCSPLREESEASFTVSPGKNLWYDFGLGVGGDMIKLVELLNGYSFVEAVQHLAGNDLPSAIVSPKPRAKAEEADDLATAVPPDIGQAQNGRRVVERYMASLKLPYYPEIQAFPLSYKGLNYIGFPVPDAKTRLGIECRGFEIKTKGVVATTRRITLGRKLPWILDRNPKFVLVTESITDALASDALTGDTDKSLLALNGVGNIKRLPDYVTKGCHCLMAMDNDKEANGKIGQRKQDEAAQILIANGCSVSYCTRHYVAGVKDLHRLLLKELEEN